MLVSHKDHSSPRPHHAAVAAAVSGPHRLLLLLLGLITFMATPASLIFTLGVMKPPDPLVQSYNTLVLNCTLTNQSLPYNASDISFQLGRRTLPRQYVRALTQWTAELRLPDVDRNISGYHMFCSLPNDLHIAHQVITVASAPSVPNITECIVYNWMNMTCYWEPKKQDTGLETTQNLYYTLLVHDDEPHWDQCPTDLPSENYCIWPTRDFHKDLTYAIVVKAANILEQVWSGVLFCPTKLKVKPDPVKNYAIEKVTNTSIKLTWQPPSSWKNLRYNITYYSEFTEVKSVFLDVYTNTSQDEITLRDLKPFSENSIEISSIPLIDQRPQGYQSNIVKLKKKTLSGVPDWNPEIGPGSFYVHEGKIDRNVTIYWQPLPSKYKNAENVSYVVEYHSSDGKVHMTRIPNEKFSITLKLAKEEAYEVTIVAESDGIGANSKLSPTRLVIPAMTNLLPSVTDLIPVKWNSHYRISWAPTEGASAYTLFYCKKRGSMCKEAPIWKIFSGEQNETTANLAVSPSDDSDYIFAMSVQYVISQEGNRNRRSLPLSTSSGMFWSKCVYHYVEKLKTPAKFQASKVQSSGSLSVEWSHPGCSYGYIQNYIIYYCLKDNCQDTLSVTADYQDYTKIWSEGLEKDKEYYVWMTASSPFSNHSDRTATITMTVKRSGLTDGALAGVLVSSFFLSVLIFCGICYIIKLITKKWKRLMDEVPITSPGIERIGQSDVDAEQINYTGETMGSGRNGPPEHSGMTRIAENESNAFLENNFSRRSYGRNEGSSHERALLMNGSAGHDAGSLMLPLEPLDSLKNTQDFPMVLNSNPHSYYNNSEDSVDPNAGQYDLPNPGAICLNLMNQLSVEQDLSAGLECDTHVADADVQDFENSGQSSIASYYLVDQCSSPKTPPVLPILEENVEPLAHALTKNNGAVGTDSGKSNLSTDDTRCNGVHGQSGVDDPGYTLMPPETVHCLMQQNKTNEENERGHDKPPDPPDSAAYVTLATDPSPDDQSTFSSISSLPGRIHLLNASGYVALPDEIPSSNTGLILEPPNRVDGQPDADGNCSPTETESVLSDALDGDDQTSLLHLSNEKLADSESKLSNDIEAENERDLPNKNYLARTDYCPINNTVSLEHNNVNGDSGVHNAEQKLCDESGNKTAEDKSSDGNVFSMDYVSLPPQHHVDTDLRWSAVQSNKTV